MFSWKRREINFILLSASIVIVAIMAAIIKERTLLLSILNNHSDEEGDASILTVSRPASSTPLNEEVNGHVRCDSITLTCLFTNLLYDHQQGSFLLPVMSTKEARILLSSVAASLILPGIGSPSDYYYIDIWSYWQWTSENELTMIKNALRQLAEEKERSDKEHGVGRRFIPIYLVPANLAQIKTLWEEALRVTNPTIIFSPLWTNNLFRTLYSGAVALYSLYEWDISPPSATVTVNAFLLENEASKLGTFASLYNAFSTTHYGTCSLLLKSCVFGLSRRGLLGEGEGEVDFPDQFYSFRMATFRVFGNMVRSWLRQQQQQESTDYNYSNKTDNTLALLDRQGPSSLPTVLFIHRRTHAKREILNLRDVVNQIKSNYNVNLRVVAFEDYSLKRQVELVESANVLIAVHGAALSHLFFLKTNSLVFEIFPYGFNKSIYRNLAAILGIRYAFWQCPRQSCSIPDIPHEEVQVSWDEQRSKDLWRNQNIKIDLIEFNSALDLALRFDDKEREKFLMYMPWEQFNNQLIGFKSACAIANFLNRTLIIPPIGHRKILSDDRLEGILSSKVRLFSPREYEWRPWMRYFNSSMINQLPCRTAPFPSFTTLTRKVRHLLMRRLGQSSRVNLRQLEDYYFGVARLEYEKAAPMPVYLPLYFEKKDIDGYLGVRYAKDRVLCLGSMFWMYSFGQPLDFPARSYQSKLNDPLYRQITQSFHFHPDLLQLADRLSSSIPGVWNSIHLRRGDYAQKCYDEGMGGSQEETILSSCFQKPVYIIRRLKKIMSSQQSYGRLPCYLATNDDKLTKLIAIYRRMGVRMITLAELLNKEEGRYLDPVERSILDQIMCIRSIVFIGNYFSSFTRTIVEQRELSGLDSQFF